MKEIFNNIKSYGAKWGCADLYEDAEEALREAIAKTEPFTTDWYGVSKECASCKIEFDGISTTVSVSVSVDELHDLAETLVWRSSGGNAFASGGYEAIEKRFPGTPAEDILEQIVETLEDDYEEYTREYRQVAGLPSYDDLLTLVREVEALAYSVQDGRITELESITGNYLAYLEESEPKP